MPPSSRAVSSAAVHLRPYPTAFLLLLLLLPHTPPLPSPSPHHAGAFHAASVRLRHCIVSNLCLMVKAAFIFMSACVVKHSHERGLTCCVGHLSRVSRLPGPITCLGASACLSPLPSLSYAACSPPLPTSTPQGDTEEPASNINHDPKFHSYVTRCKKAHQHKSLCECSKCK